MSEQERTVQLLERAKHDGRHVMQVETGTIGKVGTVLRSGFRCGDRYTAERPTSPQDAVSFFSDPIVQLEAGDAFWVKPGGFVELPEEAGQLHALFTQQLTQLLLGLGVAAAQRKIPLTTTAALAMAALRLQLRRLMSLQDGVSSSAASEASACRGGGAGCCEYMDGDCVAPATHESCSIPGKFYCDHHACAACKRLS